MGRNLQFRPADPASKLASGSNQPQSFETALQSALAVPNIAIDQRASQAECDSKLRRCAIFEPLARKFLLLMPQIPDKDGGVASFLPGDTVSRNLKAL